MPSLAFVGTELYSGPCVAGAGGGTTPSGVLGASWTSGLTSFSGSVTCGFSLPAEIGSLTDSPCSTGAVKSDFCLPSGSWAVVDRGETFLPSPEPFNPEGWLLPASGSNIGLEMAVAPGDKQKISKRHCHPRKILSSESK